MRGRGGIVRICAMMIALSASLAFSGSARADWLSAVMRESVEVASGTAGRASRAAEELAPLTKAATYLDNLNGAPEGHARGSRDARRPLAICQSRRPNLHGRHTR